MVSTVDIEWFEDAPRLSCSGSSADIQAEGLGSDTRASLLLLLNCAISRCACLVVLLSVDVLCLRIGDSE